MTGFPRSRPDPRPPISKRPSPLEFGSLPLYLLLAALLAALLGGWNYSLVDWQSTPAVTLTSEDRFVTYSTGSPKTGKSHVKQSRVCTSRYQYRVEDRVYDGSSSNCPPGLIYYDPDFPSWSTLGPPHIGPWQIYLGGAGGLAALALVLTGAGRWHRRREST